VSGGEEEGEGRSAGPPIRLKLIRPSELCGRKAVRGQYRCSQYRPGPLTDGPQNMARKRAREFGKTELTDGQHGPRPKYDDMVVSTLATEDEVDHHQPDSGLAGPSNLVSRVRFAPLIDDALERKPRGFFADQFENESNFKAHYHGTGPEILRQTSGHVDAFVSGAGGLTSCSLLVARRSPIG
jgi:cysteine synthase A